MCLVISSTPARSSPRNVSFTPVLLKTMELSYVARRSGMTPDVVAEPHVSPLKPALKNPKQAKSTKCKTIQFKSLEAKTPEAKTPENSRNGNHGILILKLYIDFRSNCIFGNNSSIRGPANNSLYY